MPAATRTPFLIDDPRQLRAIASPARQEVLDTVAATGPCTIAQIGELLGRRPDRLYFHVRRLAKVGLLRETGRRATGRRLAVVYDVPGRPLRMRYRAGDPARANAIGAAMDGVLRLARRDFGRAMLAPSAVVDGPGRNTWGGRVRGWLAPTQVREVNRLLERVMKITRAGRPRPGASPVALSLVLVPIGAQGSKAACPSKSLRINRQGVRP